MKRTLHNEEAHGDKRSPTGDQRADDALWANEKHFVGCLLQGIKRQIDKRSLYREILESSSRVGTAVWYLYVLVPALSPWRHMLFLWTWCSIYARSCSVALKAYICSKQRALDVFLAPGLLELVHQYLYLFLLCRPEGIWSSCALDALPSLVIYEIPNKRFGTVQQQHDI